MAVVPVPPHLQHPLFFQAESVFVPNQLSVADEPYFIYELTGIDKPWLKADRYVKMLDQEWRKLKKQLDRAFQMRDSCTFSSPMKALLALLWMNLYWSNGSPVMLNNWPDRVQSLAIKPINAAERLSFVMNRPFSYQAYVQINELISEQQKQLAKYQLMQHKKDG
ncbi:YpoC family protein [Bacillus xiapuensis]|uniref:YpoC family protein n=1 Tax=Bacillus xiapuensis TaxID=2014075 RepID=UPI000C251336|nr:hypothetical protein [Bacillus xiapuensis]